MRGDHILVDVFGANRLRDEDGLLDVMKAGLDAAGARSIGKHSVSYPGHGTTLIVFAAESHVLLTTWPEYDTAFLDVFLCGRNCEAERAIEVILRFLAPQREVVRHSIRRDLPAVKQAAWARPPSE